MSVPFSLRTLARKIYRDDTMPLHEKQRAWQTLLDLLPDETVQVTDPDLHTTEERSLHALLRAYLAEQRRMEQQFFADEPDTVYLAEYLDSETGQWQSAYYPALSWDGISETLAGNGCRAEITKFYPKQSENGFMKELTAVFSETQELMDVTSRMMMTFPTWRDLVCAMAEV